MLSSPLAPHIAVARGAKNGRPKGSTSATYVRFPCNFSRSFLVVVASLYIIRILARYFSFLSGAVVTLRVAELNIRPKIFCLFEGGGVFDTLRLNVIVTDAPVEHIHSLKCVAR